VNGGRVKIIYFFPFVVSLSNHKKTFARGSTYTIFQTGSRVKILLVEPDYRHGSASFIKTVTQPNGLKKRTDESLWYPPIGLLKLATFHRMRGDEVKFVIGCDKSVFKDTDLYSSDLLWDRIYITTLFTFDWDNVIKTIEFYKKSVGGSIHKIFVGGIMASIMPNDIFEETGIQPVVGILNSPQQLGLAGDEEIDLLPPDYTVIDNRIYAINDTYYAYATRGCTNKCPWCGVPEIEPTYLKYLDIKPTILKLRELYGDKPRLKLMDNNILASSDIERIVDHYSRRLGEPGYDPKYDLDHNGIIIIEDMLIEISHAGEICRPIVSFFPSPGAISRGQISRLSWSVSYANSVRIDPNIGVVGRSGHVNVSPLSTTTYTLTATNQQATSRKRVTITVQGTSSPEEPPSSEPSPPVSPGPNPTGVLNVLKLKISALPLVGETSLPLVIGGKSAEIRISKGVKTYSLNVSRNRFEFGGKITLLVGGNGILTKRFNFIPNALTKTINVGVISFGDISGNNRIDKEDVALILESIASQTNRGDINVDGAANSLDWALLQVNFGKAGN